MYRQQSGSSFPPRRLIWTGTATLAPPCHLTSHFPLFSPVLLAKHGQLHVERYTGKERCFCVCHDRLLLNEFANWVQSERLFALLIAQLPRLILVNGYYLSMATTCQWLLVKARTTCPRQGCMSKATCPWQGYLSLSSNSDSSLKRWYYLIRIMEDDQVYPLIIVY
jgi:hypothetical protein